jgi:integrase/recombinase XerD
MERIKCYRRHVQACTHKDDKTYRRCTCPVWLEANIVGYIWNTTSNAWAKAQTQESLQSRWSSKAHSWREAEHIACDLEQKLDDIVQGRSLPDQKTVKEATDTFLSAKRGEGLSPDTVYRHEYVTSLLLDFCERQGVLFIKDLTLAHLTTWQSDWSVKAPQARRSRQEKVKNFLKYCVASGMISTNPATGWKGVKIKTNDQNVRAFSESEYEKIISSVDGTTMTDTNKARIKALMQLQRWSGLSLIDAVCLSKEGLKRDGDKFRVITKRQKTGTLINNVIPTWLAEELIRVKNGNPLFIFWLGSTTPEDAPSYFHKLYRKVFKKAGIEGSSHDFRHTYAIGLLKAGATIRAVSKALGHSSVTVTEKFYSKWEQGQQDSLDDTLWAALGQAAAQ